ncbi:MAG: ABC transporter ATP-binding protein [Planctomycetes bacterium]|nr:ABC transporter ATP-binding protein [Planctomycetota bacterium]
MAERIGIRRRLGDALHVWRRLLPYLRPHRGKLAGALALTVVFVLADVLKPWPLKVVIDQVLLGHDWELLPDALRGQAAAGTLLAWACGAVLLLATISGLATWCRDLWLADAGQRAVNRVRRDALTRILGQSVAWHERHRAGDLLVRLTGDANSLRTLLLDGLFALLREGLLLAGTLTVMLLLDWRLALATVAVLPAIGLMSALTAISLRAAARKQRKKEGELATSAHETLSAVPVVQAYGLEDLATHAFVKSGRKSARAGLAATRLEGRLGLFTELALAAGIAFVLWLGVGRVQDGALTPGELVVVLTYVRAFYKPIRKGLMRSAAMVRAAASGERVLELLDASPDLPVSTNPRPLSAPRGDLVFSGVHFRHDDGRHVLTGVDLHVQAGERIAIVGDNGAGKTTLASLLPRLRDPDAGSIRIDGNDLRDLDVGLLRQAVAVVFQETVLFDGTLRENIALGSPGADAAAIAAAAQRAGVIEFATRWPLGLDTPVGARGAELSGGERQRVALARALVRSAAVVVLDEPTQGLDQSAGQQFTERLLTSLRGRTVLLITHDPRLLTHVDRVLRLADGRLVELTAATAGGAA